MLRWQKAPSPAYACHACGNLPALPNSERTLFNRRRREFILGLFQGIFLLFDLFLQRFLAMFSLLF